MRVGGRLEQARCADYGRERNCARGRPRRRCRGPVGGPARRGRRARAAGRPLPRGLTISPTLGDVAGRLASETVLAGAWAVRSLGPQREERGAMSTALKARPQAAEARDGDSAQPADVLVVFGITGDLAKVMTFHSLYRLERRGLLDCPIVGVAAQDWTVERAARPRARVHRGLRRGDRRRGVRPLRGSAVLRVRRFRRRRDVQGRGQGASATPAARCSTSRSRLRSSAWSSRG